MQRTTFLEKKPTVNSTIKTLEKIQQLKREFSIPVYYDPSGVTPLETGKKNLIFFKNFFKENGSPSSFVGLWPNDNLIALIKAMSKQYSSMENSYEKKAFKKLIEQYKRI